MIDNPYASGHCQLDLVGRMTDGTSVLVRFEDKADIVRGYKPARGKGRVTAFDAWTSYWCIDFPLPRGPNGEQKLMEYVQIDQRIASKAVRRNVAPDLATFRWREDLVHLDAMGLVTDSLERAEAQKMGLLG